MPIRPKSLHPAIHPVRWFHDWEDRILIENWIPIRFQPILFTYLAIGAAFVIVRRPTLPAMTAAVGTVNAYIWLLLAVVCPPILFIAWLMIHWGTGRKTYVGYWMRFAADIGQAFSFAAWLIGLMDDPTPETEDAYAWIVLMAVLTFLIIIVVRDVLKLILLERTSSSVQQIQDVEDAENAVEAHEVATILAARDAQDVKDVREGNETTRQRGIRNRRKISYLEDAAETSKKRADASETRADDSETREGEWSQHRNHTGDNGHDHGHDTGDGA